MRTVLAAVLITLAAALPAGAQAPSPTPAPAPTASPAPSVPPSVPPGSPTPSPTPAPPTIQRGVSAGGVDLSGQTVAQATQTLRARLRPPARRPVVLRGGGKRAVLPVRRVKYAFDAARTARRALAALPRTRVKPAITFIRTPIRTFVDAFAATVLVPARDAGVRITLRHIYRTKARAGRRVAVKKLNRVIEKALADPRRPRTKRVRPVRTKPAIGARDLKRRYASIITIDRSTFTLRLFKRLRHAKSYSVAVGQPAYPTPTGLFAIQTKQVNPTWTAPNSPWAGEAAGQSFNSSDPGNPLKARWMAVDGSVGIHGTGQDSSIGSAASHGCIRMHVSDVVDLYDRVAVGTPVLIR